MASASKQGGMRAALWTVMHAVLMNVAITTSSVVALKAFDLGPRWEWLEITILLVPVGLHFFLWPRLNLAAKIGNRQQPPASSLSQTLHYQAPPGAATKRRRAANTRRRKTKAAAGARKSHPAGSSAVQLLLILQHPTAT
jgi:hypothetical protein